MYLIAFFCVGFLSLLLLGLCRTAATSDFEENCYLLENSDGTHRIGYSAAPLLFDDEAAVVQSAATTNELI